MDGLFFCEHKTVFKSFIYSVEKIWNYKILELYYNSNNYDRFIYTEKLKHIYTRRKVPLCLSDL